MSFFKMTMLPLRVETDIGLERIAVGKIDFLDRVNPIKACLQKGSD
ncbi:hypothetical protein KXR64_23075 [Brucella intermedia]|nr:hypothetical protein [Brucella intermedia]